MKKAINESNYFNKNNSYFETINNIIAYELDNKIFYSDPIGNYAYNIKIYFYKLLLSKKLVNNFLNLVKES